MSTPQKADILSIVSVTTCFREPALMSATISPSMSTVVQRCYGQSKGVSVRQQESNAACWACTHQRQRGLVQDLLAGLPDHLVRAGEADRGDLALDMLRDSRDDVGLDGERAGGDVLAHLPQLGEVVGVNGELVDRDIVGCFGRVCPAQDGVGGGMQDVLGVGSGQLGGEGDVEGMVYDGVDDLGWSYGGGTLRRHLVVRMETLHGHAAHVGP